MKKALLLLTVLISLYGHAQSLRAMPDTYTVLQANVDTLVVTANDSIPAGDSVCIFLLGSPTGFTVLNCNSIIFQPDSFFTGRDTIRYAICDTVGICDTTKVVVKVDTNYALLPVAGFKQDTSSVTVFYGDLLFDCHPIWNSDGRSTYKLYSTSSQSDSVFWRIRDVDQFSSLYDSLKYFYIDTISFIPARLWYFNPYITPFPEYIEVCLTAYNQYGSKMYCDTSCQLQYEGIAEVPLANIHIYPNPADKVLTIDMRQNNDAMSLNYASITIYDDLGQRVRSLPRHDSSRLVEIQVTSLPDGIYLSTITDAQGHEMILGRFTEVR